MKQRLPAWIASWRRDGVAAEEEDYVSDDDEHGDVAPRVPGPQGAGTPGMPDRPLTEGGMDQGADAGEPSQGAGALGAGRLAPSVWCLVLSVGRLVLSV